PLATQHELEVLDRVRDVERVAVETGLPERAVEHLAGRADERSVAEIFLVAGLLADEHDARVGGTASEHGLRGLPEKRTALATPLPRRQPLETPARGLQRRGPATLGLETEDLLLLGVLGLPPALRRQRVKTAHPRVRAIIQELTTLVHEAPQDVVESTPAGGVTRGGCLAREV